MIRVFSTEMGPSQAVSRASSFQKLGIPEQETALCLDCQIVFHIRRKSCPKCAGEGLWLIARWRRMAGWKDPKRALACEPAV